MDIFNLQDSFPYIVGSLLIMHFILRATEGAMDAPKYRNKQKESKDEGRKNPSKVSGAPRRKCD